MILKKLIAYLITFLLFLITVILSLDYWISYKTAPYIYHDENKLPYRTIGVVLGTSKYVKGGGINGDRKSVV